MAIRQPITIGTRFGRYVTTTAEVLVKHRRYVDVVCDCGNRRTVYVLNLTRHLSKSCGCFRREDMARKKTVHGECRRGHITTEFRIWHHMLRRCRDANNPAYRNYGARGIRVCERWLLFENFLADMGRRPAGKTLDRIDNDGNYEPSNCRWASRVEQGRNKRNNRIIAAFGRSLCVSEWAEAMGVSKSTIYTRLRKGAPHEQAVHEYGQNYAREIERFRERR